MNQASQQSKERYHKASATKVNDSDVDFIAVQQNAVIDGCTTNIPPLEARSETGQVLVEIPAPNTTANLQPKPVPSTAGLNRNSLGLVSQHAISAVPEK
ncbi:hypothetical protein KGM_213136 [Danaus plexippus plexippus]|uniref:Uncharacterized protein n=1 Tax=Danaus plexippus plexippus TaxID=278856 RepID=A0A212ER16_DANPL|nr:hypothetical protein KGM_213136 [Danaus plexippus plexippus]